MMKNYREVLLVWSFFRRVRGLVLNLRLVSVMRIKFVEIINITNLVNSIIKNRKKKTKYEDGNGK